MIRAESQHELWMGGPITLFYFFIFLMLLILDEDYSILWDRLNIQLTLVISPFDLRGLFNQETVSFFHVSLCRFFCQFISYGFY
jgi:hypothetical protein